MQAAKVKSLNQIERRFEAKTFELPSLPPCDNKNCQSTLHEAFGPFAHLSSTFYDNYFDLITTSWHKEIECVAWNSLHSAQPVG